MDMAVGMLLHDEFLWFINMVYQHASTSGNSQKAEKRVRRK
jgi:hypothetical protein